jgi:hypothetical protein
MQMLEQIEYDAVVVQNCCSIHDSVAYQIQRNDGPLISHRYINT